MTAHQRESQSAFLAAAQQIRTARLRPEIRMDEIPAPTEHFAHASAFSATVMNIHSPAVHHNGDSPYGSGRLILMHDTTFSKQWGGDFRIVCFAQAPLENELATDPFVSQVAWSWLLDALERRNAEYSYASGTATKTLSTGFGSLAPHGDTAQIEIRASWTPLGSDFSVYAEAWGELLCVLAGYPQYEGVASLGAKRAQRSNGRGE